MAMPNPSSFNKAAQRMYETGVKMLASELKDGDIVIHKIPSPSSSENDLFNICSVRRSFKPPKPAVFLSIGHHDYPANHPEFLIDLETLVVRLFCYVQPEITKAAIEKAQAAVEAQ
jgi:hypothetical protein